MPASCPTMLAKQRAAVREQDLGLAHAARVDQDLARCRVARGVLGADAEVEVAERDPGRLAAPAHVDHPVAERESAGGTPRRCAASARSSKRASKVNGPAVILTSLMACSFGSGVTSRPAPGSGGRPRTSTRGHAGAQLAADERAEARGGSAAPRARGCGRRRGRRAPGRRRRPTRCGPCGSREPVGRRRRQEPARAAAGRGRAPCPSPSSSSASVCAPAIPPQTSNASPRSFSSGGDGEWSEADERDVPAAERLPQRLALGPRPQRRRALGDRAEPLDVVLVEHQVVRAGLAGHVRRRGPGLGDQRDAARRC